MAISRTKKIMHLIWKILLDETDEEQKLTRKDIAARLEIRGYTIKHKEFRSSVETLCDMAPVLGYELKREREGNKYYLWIEKRPYSIAEMQIMADMILSNKFLTEETSREMIDHMNANVNIKM